MPILGAHQSIAGGYDQAVHRAAKLGCQCVQLFTKNNNQWQAKPLCADEGRKFREALRQTGVSHPLAHDSYLINLASPDDDLWQRSIDAFAEELRRAETLGIPYVVSHPGAYTTSDERAGILRVVAALDAVHRCLPDGQSQCLLETTAGQGTSLGWRFEQLAAILDGVEKPQRLGVCFDTCHVFAAGYPLASAADYRRTMRAFDKIVGIERIRAFHLNDSRGPLGCRVDRHAHIGRGQLGRDAFRNLLRDRRFRDIPMYLETPKGTEDGTDLDEINLRTLRELADSHSPKPGRKGRCRRS